jgi:hypothetical protein
MHEFATLIIIYLHLLSYSTGGSSPGEQWPHWLRRNSLARRKMLC